MTSVAAKGDTRYTALQESSSEDGQGENGDHSKRATPAGLVTCPKTRRVSESPGQRPVKNRFRSEDECRQAAAAIGGNAWNGREGPVPQIEIYPGLIRLTAPDLNRRERTANRQADAPIIMPSDVEPGERYIREWSRKSRSRMVSSIAELDSAPMLEQPGRMGMVTLTYPGDWQAVAPDGETVKKHLQAFFRRLERDFGVKVICIWKLEFQSRGAPHFHILMMIPPGRAGEDRELEYMRRLYEWERGERSAKPRRKKAVGDGLPFRQWLSLTWADIVGVEDPVQRRLHEAAGTGIDYSEGERARDPKRMAVYFGKHGEFAAKEYQHNVPELWKRSGKSVGRFWGYRGLRKVHGTAHLTSDEMLLAGRTLRKYGQRTYIWKDGKKIFRPVLVHRMRDRRAKTWVSPAGVEIVRWKQRKQTVRARRMTGHNATGFLVVNDGVAMAADLQRLLEISRRGSPPAVGRRGPASRRVARRRAL